MADLYALIATAGDRPEMLARALEAWAAIPGVETRVQEGSPGGLNYNRLAADLPAGAVFLPTCDDTLPIVVDIPALHAHLDRREVPVCRYIQDGKPLHTIYDTLREGDPVTWTRQPLLSVETWQRLGPFLELNWYLDLDYSDRLRQDGWRIVGCDHLVQVHLNGSRAWSHGGVADREREVYENAAWARNQRGVRLPSA